MIGTKVMLRVRFSARDAHYAGELIDGARTLALFGDLATELLVRLDGDEGLFRAYEAVEFLAPIFAGDFVEADAELIALGETTRVVRFEARKVISNVRRGGSPPSAAEVLEEPVVVCRAVGTCVTPKELQRRPRALYMPALPAGPRPEPDALVTPPEQASELVLTAALLGMGVSPQSHALSSGWGPREIADEAARCEDAGAAVVHLHLHVCERDGAAGQSTGQHAEIIGRIHEKTECIVQVSTGGPHGASLEQRAQPLRFSPDMATLSCGSVNVGDDVLITTRPQIRELAARICAAASAVALECYDVGHVDEALSLVGESVLSRPYHVQFVLGVKGAIGAREDALRFMVGMLPPGAQWGIAALGHHHEPMTELGIRLGGHARVGLEDNGQPSKRALANTIAPLVARAALYGRSNGRTPVGPGTARRLLGLVAKREEPQTAS